MSKLTERSKRYDRQLRLWGDHGQDALENCKVCLINATALGTEILKNLVLPGIGAFTIVDDHVVTGADVGSNFFLVTDMIGLKRGKCVADFLSSINTEVRTYVCTENVRALIETTPEYFCNFSVIIATDVVEDDIKKLSEFLWGQNIPLLIAKCYGFIGYLRIVIHSHEIIESHPDNSHEDLRLDHPFSELKDYSDKLNLDELDDTQHSNVPFLLVLVKYLEKWKCANDGACPLSYQQKIKFKEFLRTGIRMDANGVPLQEDNFDEALRSVNSVLVPSMVPDAIKDLFEHHFCSNLSYHSKNFWFLVRALRDFVMSEGNGLLPLRGSIPDMVSSSDMYVSLQKIYYARAQKDIEVMRMHLLNILSTVGKSNDTVCDIELKLFCRNSAFLRHISTRSLNEEILSPNLEEFSVLTEEGESDAIYYLLLRASECYYNRFKVYPGDNGELPIEADVAQYKMILTSLLEEWHLLNCTISDEHILEFCRYGAGEIHSVVAYLGGVASHEAIKIVTHQYMPIDNTYIYNAATSTSVTMKL